MVRGLSGKLGESVLRITHSGAFRGVIALAVVIGATTAATGVGDDERLISFYNIHTKETIKVVYKRQGRYVKDAMKKINHIMRDWRRDKATKMDPTLIDLIWEIHTQLGSQKPIHVISGYRSRKTNERLRRRGGGQARNSRHIMGKAADVHFPDVSAKQIRNSALIRERGGVGYYPTSAIPFVHLDTTGVRHWPRLGRLELAALFPNGKTKHRPRKGGPITKRDYRKAMARLSDKDKRLIRIARGEIKPDVRPIAPVQVAKLWKPSAPVMRAPIVTVPTQQPPGGATPPKLPEFQPQQGPVDARALTQLAAAISTAPAAPVQPTAQTKPPVAASPGPRPAAAVSPARPQARPQAAPKQIAAISPEAIVKSQERLLAKPAGATQNTQVGAAKTGQPQNDSRMMQIAAAMTRPLLKSTPAQAALPSDPPRLQPSGHANETYAPSERQEQSRFQLASADPLGDLIERQVYLRAEQDDRRVVGPLPQRQAALQAPDSAQGAQQQAIQSAIDSGWLRAPEVDDDHDNELAYLPFPILPLMGDDLTGDENPYFAKMSAPEYTDIFALTEEGPVPSLRFRQGGDVARRLWTNDFSGTPVASAEIAQGSAHVKNRR